MDREPLSAQDHVARMKDALCPRAEPASICPLPLPPVGPTTTVALALVAGLIIGLRPQWFTKAIGLAGCWVKRECRLWLAGPR
jgi:hypothetical protein